MGIRKRSQVMVQETGKIPASIPGLNGTNMTSAVLETGTIPASTPNSLFHLIAATIIGRVLFLIVFILLFHGCIRDNEPEVIPAYVRIKNFTFNTTTGQGNNTHSISDAWIYIDGKIIGVYELPCIFPILEKGIHELKIYAGIFPDGMHNVRISYPFYSPFKMQVELIEKNILEIVPEINFTENLKTPLIFLEEFNQNYFLIEPGPQSDVDSLIIEYDSLPYIGNYGILYGRKDTAEKIDWASHDLFSVPEPGSPVFLEMHFKSSISFFVGVYAHDGFGGVTAILDLVMLPKNVWRKVYVNLTGEISAQPVGTTFKILFRGQTTGNTDQNGKPDFIALDNLRLLQTK